MQPPFLDTLSKPLLVLHGLTAGVLLGATTHLAWELSRAWIRNRLPRPSTGIWSRVAGLAYLVAFTLGLLMYPAYRYRVRGLYLDRYEPWASNLFDVKENLLALGMPLAVGLLALASRPALQARGPATGLRLYLSLAVWALVAASAIAGVVVTSVKGV